jgi:hypothetical protein
VRLVFWRFCCNNVSQVLLYELVCFMLIKPIWFVIMIFINVLLLLIELRQNYNLTILLIVTITIVYFII